MYCSDRLVSILSVIGWLVPPKMGGYWSARAGQMRWVKTDGCRASDELYSRCGRRITHACGYSAVVVLLEMLVMASGGFRHRIRRRFVHTCGPSIRLVHLLPDSSPYGRIRCSRLFLSVQSFGALVCTISHMPQRFQKGIEQSSRHLHSCSRSYWRVRLGWNALTGKQTSKQAQTRSHPL